MVKRTYVKHFVTMLFTAAVIFAVVSVAGCASNTSTPRPAASSAPTASTAINGASSSVPTSVNGHDYTYYHNLNDPSTCRLCHANM
jgi:ABC-type phosphate transport system substrate-binding protein